MSHLKNQIRKIFIAFLCVNSLNSFAQKIDPILLNDFTREARSGGSSSVLDVFTTFDNRYKGLEGSYYTSKDWLIGDLFNKSGEYLRRGVLIKYDAVNQELVMKKPDGDSAAVYPYSFTMINADNITKSYFLSIPSKTNPDKIVYMQILFNGKIKILKEPKKFLSRANYKDPYGERKYTDSFEDISRYYSVDNIGNLIKFKLKRQSILNLVKSKKREMKSFTKDKLIDFEKEKDLIMVLQHFDRIS